MNLAKWKKAFTIAMLAGILSTMASFSVLGAEKLYDQVTSQVITKGVTYEKNHRLTAEGWQDIYVLKIPLNDPSIQFAPVSSAAEYGLKETVLKMLYDSNAVAGVNASFFGMKGKYSASFGIEMKEGNLLSVGTDINGEQNEYVSFFMDKEGNPFLHFLKTKLDFYADGQSFFEIASVNKVTDMIHPMYFDRNAGMDTSALDARFPDLAKIVVEDGVITQITGKGEIVVVPENGYLIVMSGTTYDFNVQNFAVGQTAEFKITASLDLNQIQTAISGGGLILSEGAQVGNPGQVIKSRQPRTALGITQDKNTMILMVVDGRGDSIGATQTEMAYLMLEYGAYDAMHFDGGGSTIIAAKTVDDAALELKNIPSEGTQRKVINALGIFNHGPVGELSQIVIKPDSDKVFRGTPVTLNVIGYDEYYHPVEVPLDQIQFVSSDEGGIFNANQFIPSVNGNIIVTASYQGLNAVTTLESMTLAELTPNLDEISLGIGETATLSFTGTSTDAIKAPVSQVTLVSDYGTAVGQTFTATNAGAGYIECSIGEIRCFVKVFVGGSMDSVVLPQGNQFTDFKKTAITGKEEGYYYINMIGQITSSIEDLLADPVYEQLRANINQKVQENADLSVFVGNSNLAVQNAVETIQWQSGYQFYDKGNVGIVQMTAVNGTLRNSNTWQWQAFKGDVLGSASKHIIFIMDKTPGGFTDPLEAELFRDVLEELRVAGKDIFVVASGNGSSWDVVKDGIRYIQLPNLWNEDGTVNPEFKLLTFKINGDTIQYDIKNAM